MYNSKYYTCEQIDQRLLEGYYDDAVAAGYTGSKAQYLAGLLKAINYAANPTLTADKVVYNPAISGLTHKNIQDAIDELSNKKANSEDVDSKIQTEQERVNTELGKKFDKESILQESGDAEDKVMSQKAVSDKLSDLSNDVTKLTSNHFLTCSKIDAYISPDGNLRDGSIPAKGYDIYLVKLKKGYTINISNVNNSSAVSKGMVYSKSILGFNDIIGKNLIASFGEKEDYTAIDDCYVAISHRRNAYDKPLNVLITSEGSSYHLYATDAIEELQTKKLDKTSVVQEIGEAENKVMSQKAVSKTIIEPINRIDFLSKQSFFGFLSHGIIDHYISPDKNIRKNKGSYIYIVYLQKGYTITFNYSSNRKGVTLDGGAYKKDIKSTNDIISTNCIAELSQNTAYTATEDCIVAIPYFPQDYPTTPISVVISNGETSYKLHGSDYFDKDSSFKDLLSNFGTSYKEHYTSAALMFYSKIKVGSIVYARLVTDAKIDVAKCLVNDDEIGIKLTKDFQKIDLSKYSTGRFQVYASFDKEADVTLEVISATLLADAMNDNKEKLDYAVNLKNRGHYSMTSISVKKDGTGDFTSIQEAINSITDASPINQYDIMVYDDFIIKDLTELYSEYGTKNTNNGIDVPLSSNCALFATKNWVNVRGVGRKMELSVISPSNLAAESFKFIQTILLQGNCTVENFKVTIKGGRYAIHQDKSGAKSSIDYCATTTLKNVDVIHYGNKDYVNGKSWAATCAQANGTCDGLKLIYKNCTWYSKETAPFYTHAGYDMDEPSKLYFEGCSMYRAKETALYDSAPYFGDLGSGKELEVEIVGCNFRHFRGFTESNICGYEKARVYDDVRLGGVMLHGHSNAKMTLNKRFMKCLTFRTTAKNKSIKVIGGSAFDDIFGGVYKHYDCAPDAVGEESGIRKIFDASTTNVYSLAYRLGNCKTSHKTLSIEVDGEAHDITFSNNYMTTDGSSYNETTKPALNNSAIVREINEQLSSLGVSCDTNCNDGFKYFEDQELYICNNSDETFMINDFLVKDGAEFIKANSSNYKNIVAIVAERINVGSCGRIIYINNCYIPRSGEKGTMYKFSNNSLVSTNNIDEAKFIQVDSSVIEMIK